MINDAPKTAEQLFDEIANILADQDTHAAGIALINLMGCCIVSRAVDLEDAMSAPDQIASDLKAHLPDLWLRNRGLEQQDAGRA